MSIDGMAFDLASTAVVVFAWVLYQGRNDKERSARMPLVIAFIGAAQILSSWISSWLFPGISTGNGVKFFDGFTWRTIGVFGIGLGLFFSGIALLLKHKLRKK